METISGAGAMSHNLPCASSSSMQRQSKRKRNDSDGARHSPTSSAQQDALNPFSRSASRQRQLLVAGVSDNEEDPSQDIKGFPHRGIRTEELYFSRSDEEGASQQLHENAGPAKLSAPRQSHAAHPGSRLDIILRTIHQLLDEGQIQKSAKLFGVILQLRPNGRPIDIRQHGLWAIGAEIIMRGGEEDELRRRGFQMKPFENGGIYIQMQVTRIWGSNANMNKLRAYFEGLIRKYPYDRKFPGTVSAIDFQLALIACEIFHCHAHNMREILSPSAGKQTWGKEANPPYSSQREGTTRSDPCNAGDDRKELGSLPRPSFRIEDVKEQISRTLTNIASNMDTMVNHQPYSGNKYFLHLRAIVSLMLADLHVLITRSKHCDSSEATALQKEAHDLLRKATAVLDCSITSALDASVRQTYMIDESRHQRLHVSLPIREM